MKMDISCIILTCILLLQMTLILTMLNPIYDVRKIITYINNATSKYKKAYYTLILSYFVFVVYLGMYIPLQNIHVLIFSFKINDYDKLLLLSRVEKNYIIAGYSLFLVVVLYGVKALLVYTATLVQMIEKSSEPQIHRTNSKKFVSNDENFLPNLLRVNRSISYEAILCANELKEQLKLIMKNFDPNYKNTFSTILDPSHTTKHTV